MYKNSKIVKLSASLICPLVLLMIWSQPLLAQNFASHADVIVSASTWTYTLHNDETLGSPNYITSFSLSFNAPITVVSAPVGWDATTDNASYVFWFNTDQSLPYPNDVGPGNALSGFVIGSTTTISETLGYSVLAWDHSQDAPGPSALGGILAPSTPAAVPEPSTVTTFSIGALSLLLFAVRRRVKSTGRSV